jgi:hypothetical protein
VSDQDFFSEGEETEPKDDKATKASGKTAPAKSGPKPASKAPAKATATATKAPQPETSFFDQTVTMAMAILLAVVGLLLGMIVGYFVFSGGAQTTATAPDSLQTPSTTGTGTAAPPLTQDQLNAGQLPAGHPKVGGSTTPTPTK